ncbi:MAG: TonB family protein [Brevundimonas sp.]|nr:TonB family protein [Brevundimonas sp.]
MRDRTGTAAVAAAAGLILLGGCATNAGGAGAGANRAEVELSCAVNADGSLRDCRVEREDPAGEGFGEAALRTARQARVQPRDGEQAGPDSRIRWTTRFERAR